VSSKKIGYCGADSIVYAASLQGIDEYQEESVEKGAFYLQDPTGRRTGNACDPKVSKVIE
jgi:hypothetical protein